MTYPVELLTNRNECLPVLADTRADIARVELNILNLQHSSTLRTTEATEDSAAIVALTDQITPLEVRVAGMSPGEARTKEEVRLRALRREREEIQDEQLGGQGSRGVFRRARLLDAAQRQLGGFQDCLAQVQTRHDGLPI